MSKRNSKKIIKEFYAIEPPFAYVVISQDREGGLLRYEVLEPPLSDQEKEALKEIKELLLEEINVEFLDVRDYEKARVELDKVIDKVVRKYKIKVGKESLKKIKYYLFRDLLGYGKIDVLMKDPNVEDISCDGVNVPVYIWHRKYESLPTNIVFTSKEELLSFINKLAYKAGRQITIARPIVDGMLPEGYRAHMVLDEVALRGGSFTIRKFAKEPYTIIDLILFRTISPKIAAYLWLALEHKKSMIIFGSTGAGKTTLLNAVAMLIRPEAKIITIEETPELRLPHENWVPLVTRSSSSVSGIVSEITLFDLLKAALRMRPDYIIVGEIRGEEAYTLFQAIATGHAGLSTVHADSVESLMRRLESKPISIPRRLIPLMKILIHIARVKVRGEITRRVVDVYEIVGLDERKEVKLNKAFEWIGTIDQFDFSEKSEVLKGIAEEMFMEEDEILDELERRARLLEYMAEKGLRSFSDVARVVREYYTNPDRVLRRVGVI
ncbi:MAG: hypothetical protein DRJ66_07515 [Thermoprotei archaeon]|nr:MAG: hypothetical protein DRJ66_07515 [Thermoprotei archaeon]